MAMGEEFLDRVQTISPTKSVPNEALALLVQDGGREDAIKANGV